MFQAVLVINSDVIQINQGLLPFASREDTIESPRKVAEAFFKPNSILTNLYIPEWQMNVVFSWSEGLTGTFQYPQFASRVEKTSASQRESIHSSIIGMG